MRLVQAFLSILLVPFNVVSTQSVSSAVCYDYVIVGGGTCGLVLANRLSEDSNVTVAIIEAGGSVFDNPNVTITTGFGHGYFTPIDYAYNSTPQVYTGNSTQTYHSGKALGGTSTINGATYIRAETAQIDGWEDIGNTGWNWSSLWPYYKKSENFQPPTPSQAAHGITYQADAHGYHGHVDVGWSVHDAPGNTTAIIGQSWNKLGYPTLQDDNTGNLRGFYVWPRTLNRTADIRADAARSYFWPIADRPNLHAYTFTTANRLLWSESVEQSNDHSNRLTAMGVQVINSEGFNQTIAASKEVIISAGSLRSPVVLEQSGVGNPQILSQYGIKTQVALPNVGENLQDQPNTNIVYSSTLNLSQYDYPPFVTFATAQDLFETNTSAVESYIRSQIPIYAAQIAALSHNSTTAIIQERLLTQQTDLIFNQSVPVAEMLTAPFTTAISNAFWDLLPFSRGSVHMTSTLINGSAQPAINPNFFMLDKDTIFQAGIARVVRRALSTPPLADVAPAELVPNTTAVPSDASDDEWAAWLKQTYTPNSHPLGTCAMMARELGGVVDLELRVYGTANVRVVDASVLPYQIQGHLTSTLYAVAERASDIIRGLPLARPESLRMI
ncbi:MAG: hypothetical protein M1820_000762 [Bogoriella megaspora]|nr:MAG: hypothetical protein M1820_000762 [Bogoriella megaspora]